VERSADSPTPFGEFVRVIAILRGPDGCPWDRVQTHRTLRKNIIEEAYETVAAIESEDDAELAEELGDVLLQVVLHAQIAADEDRFDIDDVALGITEKIRRRHPHIFGEAQAGTPDEVLANWDKIKHAEKSGKGHGALEGIPHALPALMHAQTISRKAVAVGFEWETLDDVWAKVHEEIDELKATQPGSPEAVDEIGDVLFTVVNLARKQGIDAEMALRQTCEKFRMRWADMEASAAGMGRSLSELSLDEMESLWQQAKDREEPR
jgi:tetrapyrrole methylase family protein/MazG family protein